MTSYDDQNVFAKILRGELPCHKIHETDSTLAFMDVMPRCDGHCLVIPKNPSRNLLDIDPADLASLMASTQIVMRAVKKAFEADGITIQQFNEPAAGQEVFHTHIHILPRFDGVRLGHHTTQMADNDELAEHAKMIVAALDG
ncbi:MAG TPA: HIT family protein [Rhizobiales bacterium]|nr:HIT family protein [Hyphomicrobiales bacterium]